MTDLPLFSSKFEEKQKYWKLRITQILDRNKLATEKIELENLAIHLPATASMHRKNVSMFFSHWASFW